MAIIVNQQAGIFTLETQNTTYQMKVDQHKTLLHLYYGAKIPDANLDYLLWHEDVGFSPNPYEAGTDRTYSLDLLPQEYPSFGVGDYRGTGLMVRHEDGSRAVRLQYADHEISRKVYHLPGLPAAYTEDGRGETLTVRLKDEAAGLEVFLYYGVFPEVDVITRAVEVKNCGAAGIWLEKVHSACLDLPFGKWEMVHFHGRHNMERLFERTPLGHGTFSIGSRRGMSSHQHNPAAIICAPETTEDYGTCYGMTLLYSGNFTLDAECDQMNQLRITMGISPEQFCWLLEPGAAFHAPQTAMTCSTAGFASLTNRFHPFIRRHICRGPHKSARRPVLLNNWEATYFNFNEEKISRIADQAAALGIEMLVLDDGWFGQRDDDFSGLGDWYVNTRKLKGGLNPLAARINELGMKFGLWVEPEMVSEDSDLYRKNPDWALQIPGRRPARGRMQLVLDMGRPEVRDYLEERLSEILSSAPIDYVKWDFNRSISDVYSQVLPPERQGEGLHRFVLGLYDLLERLTSRFPEVLFEGCSGGGGRFDAGMLYYTPQIWCSDDTDAIERLEIQHGTSFFYPVSAVGSHVSACPNHQTGRNVPLNTRAVVAMAGSFGYELDLNLLDEAEKTQVKQQVKAFIRFNELIRNGHYYRLESPDKNNLLTAWEFAAPDGSEALVSIVFTHVRANWPAVNLKPKGLSPHQCYQLEWLLPDTGCQDKYAPPKRLYSGAALLQGGLTIPMLKGDYPALQLYFSAVR